MPLYNRRKASRSITRNMAQQTTLDFESLSYGEKIAVLDALITRGVGDAEELERKTNEMIRLRDRLHRAHAGLDENNKPLKPAATKKQRNLKDEGRRNISEGQKKRWEKFRENNLKIQSENPGAFSVTTVPDIAATDVPK